MYISNTPQSLQARIILKVQWIPIVVRIPVRASRLPGSVGQLDRALALEELHAETFGDVPGRMLASDQIDHMTKRRTMQCGSA